MILNLNLGLIMEETFWILESTPNPKFPYRLSIQKGGKTILSLRVQDRWPGTRGHIFCLREEAREWPEPLEELERIRVLSLRRFGKRIAVVLDRPQKKRCDFLFLEKPYKTKEGKYEQIFWRTEKALRERRPRVKLTVHGSPLLHIAIDTKERYPWQFTRCRTERVQLPVGDYALFDNQGIRAIIERKTIDNMLAEFARMSVFHQHMGELESYPNSALVIEAHYSDFLKPEKLKFYPPSFAQKALAEIFALHPRLQVVFAGNRKLGREWTLAFFTAIVAHESDIPLKAVAEAIRAYGQPPEVHGGADYDVRKQVESMPPKFTLSMLREACPNVSSNTLRKVLNQMKKEGRIRCFKRTWVKP